MKEDTAESDDEDYERWRSAREGVLLHPHMEAELEWLRSMQSTVVDAGLTQISIRKLCLLLNVVSAGLGTWLLLRTGLASEPSVFWMGGFILANIATVGVYVGVAVSLASHRTLLFKINERARVIDSKLNGNMALGSAIDARI